MRKTFLTLAENNAVYRMIVGNSVTRAMTRRFVAGESLDEALAAMKELNAFQIRGSLDLLGENVHTEQEARAAGAYYETIVERIAEAGLDTNVSLKLTQMGLDLSEDLCFEVTSGVIARARHHGNFVRIDMEGSLYTERTLAVFKRLHAVYGRHVGIVLQAYLHRTRADVEQMIELGARVRLCKGAYLEPPEVAFPDKVDVDRNYVACMKRLLSAGHYPGLATHDTAIIEEAKAYVAREGITSERFEFQMLYGIRRDLQESLVAGGFNMRCYVPFGTQWYPYFMRRLAERPANVWFLLHNVMKR
ncbi:MAG: proline dehydrogenase family protein [Candidatus Sericytochromatia bacterium]|nr:proline dehydrogenase family protein [Candidatus Sericytochromatia bacterium]